MKKALLVTEDFYPFLGGVSTYWEHLGEHMPIHDWVVLAPLLSRGAQEKQTLYRIYRKKFYRKWLFPRWIPIFFHIASVCKREHIQMIVVTHVLPVGTVARMVSLVFRIPYCVSVHGLDISLALRNKRKKALCGAVLRHASFILANSQSTAHTLSFYRVNQALIHLLYPSPSITPALLDPTWPSQLRAKFSSKKILLTVGRLVRRKGHEYVVRALPGLLVQFPDLVYCIVGDGPHREFLEHLTDQLSLRDHVVFLGSLPPQEIAGWYHACSIFIMTPEEVNGDVEGFGIVYLEAGSFGKPVIGTRTGGVPEAVIDGETGMLIEQKNSVEIQETIRRLLDDPEFAHRLGQRGRERVAESFNWKQQAEKLQYLLSL